MKEADDEALARRAQELLETRLGSRAARIKQVTPGEPPADLVVVVRDLAKDDAALARRICTTLAEATLDVEELRTIGPAGQELVVSACRRMDASER